jgi:hypothetical protein
MNLNVVARDKSAAIRESGLAFCLAMCQQHGPIKFGQDPYVL